MIRVTPGRRLAFFLGVDAILISASMVVAFELRFEGRVPQDAWPVVATLAGVAVAAYLILLLGLGVYRVSWSFVGLRDIALVALASLLSTAVLSGFALTGLLHRLVGSFPRSVVLIHFPIAFIALSAFRLVRRMKRLIATRRRSFGSPTLIIGAGRPGVQVLESIAQSPGEAQYEVVGFLDDDPLSHRTEIQGVSVVGNVASLERHVRRYGVETVIVCIAEARSDFVSDLVKKCKALGVKHVRIIPPMSQLVSGRLTIAEAHEVGLEDLLGREPVAIRVDELERFFRKTRVLVTGGAGTIGAELCRQVVQYGPSRITVLDVDETRLHDLVSEVQEANPGVIVDAALADVRDVLALEAAFADARPDVVFHAAAYKHVTMMETRPTAALDVNVLGTHNVTEAARRHGCRCLVLVSTDKAVHPSSIMGASKRLAESVCLGAPKQPASFRRMAVRFGNVLGSRGSVIPIFERQLRAGLPLTVTHPEVERFFMMTSEAVALVLQSAVFGEDGDLFVLDMGKRVKILEVARQFLRLQGHQDVDRRIRMIGLRPGEKLIEELHYPDEALEPTLHPRIMKVRAAGRPNGHAPEFSLEGIKRLVGSRSEVEARRFFEERFPSLNGGIIKAP
jgi:FlaA1/EpsC-like NDP-sugar epimerase